MSITVIIPTYNRSEQLKVALNSLMKQSRPADQLVIVARASDKLTHQVIEDYKKLANIKLIKVGEESKITKLENIGLSEAKGDIYAFLDDDGEVNSNWLERAESNLKKNDVGATGGPILEVNEKKTKGKKNLLRLNFFGKVIDGMNCVPEEKIECDHLPGSNMVMRKDVFEKFDENLLGYCYRFEMDACLQIKKRGYKLMFDPAMIQLHHNIRAKLGKKERSLKEVYETQANNTYVILKHLKIFQKLCFLIYTFIWGDGGCPGFFRYMAQALKNRSWKKFIASFYALLGKTKGILMWISIK